jgi:hypothetical protein
MRKRDAVIFALVVPFIVVTGISVIAKSVGSNNWSEIESLVAFLAAAGAGFVFLAVAFRPLHAFIIGVVYFPLMILAMMRFLLALGGGV